MRDVLCKGAAELGLNIDPEPYLAYITFLSKWNRAYNLTAIQDPKEMVTKHVLDSLAIVPFIHGKRILDVGSGAGLPGIPLALYFQDKTFVLLDSHGKKTRFLQEMVRRLGLTHVEIVQSRAEDYEVSAPFDTVTARAVSEVRLLLKWTDRLLAPGGEWVAMKGKVPDAELALLNSPYEVHPYTVPGVEGQRCVVCIKKQDSFYG